MAMLSSLIILTSAFLLFTVQLIIGKIMLPYFGGSPSVWNTSMMFYQILLLAGYVYAHLLGTYLKPRWQPIVHWALFGASLVLIRFTILPEQVTQASTHPIITQLNLMTVLVGLPFFVLSATAPLIQRWFFLAHPGGSKNVYLLYATSNLGSFLALIAYPVVIEPLMALDTQILIWRSMQYILFGLFVTCGAFVLRLAPLPIAANTNIPKTSIPVREILLWIILGAIPSSLSLGVTMTITTDIASMPLIWVIPLALYLLTFILAFRDKPLLALRPAFLLALILLLPYALFETHLAWRHSVVGLAFSLLAFFAMAYTCHRALYERRPDARHLTTYYIYLSVGGAVGGIYNSLIVPNIFTGAYEYNITLIAATILLLALTYPLQLRSVVTRLAPLHALIVPTTMLGFALAFYMTGHASLFVVALLLTMPSIVIALQSPRVISTVAVALLVIPVLLSFKGIPEIHQERNYFGVKRVVDARGIRHFTHGTTNHGSQIQEEKYRLTPVTYYNPTGPAADIFRAVQSTKKNPNILVLGLGIGGLSCLTEPTSQLTYIEIDPAVVKLAENRNYFTFVSDCGPQETMVIGDGRLELAKMPDASFDLLFMDAFSSDSIPFHLVTREAVELYLKKIKPDGLVVFHISNRYFQLAPELAAIARDLDLRLIGRDQPPGFLPGTKYPYSGTLYVALVKSDAQYMMLAHQHAGWHDLSQDVTPPEQAWTDRYVNVIRALHIWKKFVKLWD